MRCETCGGPIPDAKTSRRRYCTVRCRRLAEHALRRVAAQARRDEYAAQWGGLGPLGVELGHNEGSRG